jgi:hypothetical protein
LVVLSADFFSVPEEEIKAIESEMTIMDGEIVLGRRQFASHGPQPLPVLPDWSPVGTFGGAWIPRHAAGGRSGGGHTTYAHAATLTHHHHPHVHGIWDEKPRFACGCFAF